ncbi:xylan 1,4-beta-xylosidase [Silvibacterium bohemicum]|uniref:Xylan 1,4-beta-xylosidase n=1 Tax=Silvibacterium bohemicum TaxID=1577686 RepID=A0A841K4Y8_9BACT|nr:glycosyl hydrolase family 39 [Silvibacterium bohemicum]MBB6146211.1 xylan 1,4-beta-xylosidase [Silvibacterium bohemicum]
MNRSIALVFALALISVPASSFAQQTSETVEIDAKAQTTPLPHFWEQMFGSGRANLSLRQGYREDMSAVQTVTDFKYVRFHAIFQDENGVYDEDAQGNPVYNWSYVDQIYDGLLANGVRPFVEISFMPKKLAARLDYHAFWYKQIVSPPRDYSRWDALITAFAQHLIERYGIAEVSQWYFEVWNEPNIDFWTGRPAQQTYFELYDHTARALKAVNGKIRVGGPATAQAAWVGDMIAHATQNNVPLDFVSTHVYGNDTAKDVFGDNRPVPPHQMVCAAVSKVHDQIKNSAKPNMPLIWSEFNATYANEQPITDSIYMGPWMADTIRQCDGKVDLMSYWTFSDVFEEQGVIKTPFYGGYGLIAEDGIPKPAFNVFALLHQLGEHRIAVSEDDVLVTRRGDDTIVIAAWNLVEPEATGPDKTFTFQLTGLPAKEKAPKVTIRRVDAEHGDTLAAWKKMGSPKYPTTAQIAELKRASEIGKDEVHPLEDGKVTVTVPQKGLALIEVR